MTNLDDFIAPWTIDFDHDGTEDIAVIFDADGYELVRSRTFWLPEEHDPEPETLTAMRLIYSAPKMLAALRAIVLADDLANECAEWKWENLEPAFAQARTILASLAAAETPWHADDWYSVMLLNPAYANESGTETYYTAVKAPSPAEAIAAAQRQAAVDLTRRQIPPAPVPPPSPEQQARTPLVLVKFKPEDFVPLLVARGRHASEPIFDK